MSAFFEPYDESRATEFVPAESEFEAYADSPLSIGEQQTISQPYIVALMTQMLDVAPGHRVLEIGTGSGYQTAVLRELASEIYTIEVRKALLETAERTLAGLGYSGIHFRLGDGAEGWPEFAPFDRIIVTACATEIPSSLTGQLSWGPGSGGEVALPDRAPPTGRRCRRWPLSPRRGQRFSGFGIRIPIAELHLGSTSPPGIPDRRAGVSSVQGTAPHPGRHPVA